MEPSKNEMTIINNAIKELGHLPMKDINKKVVKDFYAENRRKKQYAMANYKREIVQRIWNFNLEENDENCVSFEDLGNPAHHKIALIGADKKKKKKAKYWTQQPSEAKVKDEQIRPLFDAIELEEHSDKKNLIKLFFYLGQHPFTEISMMRWEQLSEDDGQWWWNMEEGFHKTGYKHSVPLHPTVMKIIDAQRGKDETYIFVSNFRKDNQGNLLPYQRSGFSKQIQRIKELLEDNTITYQCFRATVTTKLRELAKGHEPSYLMNQRLQGISERVYTRSEFRELKIAMVNDWMDFIEGQLNDTK
jgi:integrase